jgi:uncharacterized protein
MNSIAEETNQGVPTATVQVAQPISASERIDALDYARGFALFGIILMNVEWFERPIAGLLNGIDGGYVGVHLWIDRAIEWLIQGKFYPLFSLLFGMGFAVMLQRGEERSGAGGFTAIYLRRLLALLAFGFIHGVLFYPGDILHAYAFAGFGLMLGYGIAFAIGKARGGRRLSSRWLLILPLLPLLILPVIGNLYFIAQQAFFAPPPPAVTAGADAKADDAKAADAKAADAKAADAKAAKPAEKEKTMEERRAERRAQGQKAYDDARKTYQTGSFVEVTQLRYSELMRQASLFRYFGPGVLMFFVLGSWFVFSGVLRDIPGHLPLFRKLAGWGLGLGIPLAAIPGLIQSMGNENVPMVLWGVFGIANESSHLLMCVGYFALMVLVSQSLAWSQRFAWLSDVGRMALTNYILQSAVFSVLFSGYGLGLHGHLQRGWQVLLAVALFAAQVLFSRWWMARYRFGPLEWLWRALTYLRAPPMLR